MIQVNRIYLIFNRLVTKKFVMDTSETILNILSGTMNWRVTDVVFYMVIGIWQEAIFRYIIMIVQVGMLKKGLC